MKMIEQIDCLFAPDSVFAVTIYSEQWQQIKDEFSKLRNDALEEAAKVCDARMAHYDNYHCLDEANGAESCADDIRALKEPS